MFTLFRYSLLKQKYPILLSILKKDIKKNSIFMGFKTIFYFEEL